MDALGIANTALSLGAGTIGAILVYRNGKVSNQTARENTLVDQLQEQVQTAMKEASEAKAEARQARDESSQLRAQLARYSTFAWSLYDHINRGLPPPPPEWPDFAK